MKREKISGEWSLRIKEEGMGLICSEEKKKRGEGKVWVVSMVRLRRKETGEILLGFE